MYYELLIRRLLPFSVGFLAAVFVTSFFQTVAAVTQTAHVPAVDAVYYGSSKSCKNRMRGTQEFHDIAVQHQPEPGYTVAAREKGTEGSVVLRVTFLASGEIGDIEPLKELGDGLTERAIAAARRISFRPATRNDTPVTTTKEVEYMFSIY